MEYERVVQVRLYPDDGGAPFVGSGYLIAPGLVLTAGHVLGDGAERPDAGRVTVQASVSVLGGVPSRPEVSAEVAWYRRTTAVDAALLELDSDSDERFVQRWGFLIGSRPCPVSLTGFPRMQRDEVAGPRSAKQLDGLITAGNQATDGRFEIASSDPTRKLTADAVSGSATRWSGVSGAAVITADADDDLLCGVVRHDLQADGGTILTATPVRTLLADAGFVEVLTAHGVGVRAEPVEPSRLLAPVTSPPVSGSPAGLLRADVEAVAFAGRERELDALLAWCRGGVAGVSVRVLAGPSGQGKSRLARQLTVLMQDGGWVSGHLRAEVTDFEVPEGFPGFETLRTELPLLLVVDYAETRPNRVRALLTQLSNTRQRARVLLLARSDGPWRTEAHNATVRVRDLLNLAEVTELSALYGATASRADSGSGPGAGTVETGGLVRLRREAFGQAAHSLAAMLPLVPGLPAADWSAVAAALPTPANLADARYENVLTLQLAALTGLLQHGPTPVPAAASASAEKILLDHEKRFWAGSAASPAFRLDTLPTATLDAAVAAAVLCGAADHAEVVQVLGAVTGLTAQQIPFAAAWLAQLYPAAPGRLWASLQPDRVGEYHAAAVLTAPIKTLDTSRLLTGAAPAQQAQFVTVMARAAVSAYNAGRTGDTERIVATVNSVVEDTKLDRRAMQAASDTFPYPNRVVNRIAVLVAGLLVETEAQHVAQNPGADESDLATSLANLGVYLSDAGRRFEGLAATQQAVEIRRRLAEEDPAHAPNLASVLSNLGSHLSQAGRRDEALAATEQAVEILRRLAADNSAAHEADLASALSNLGNNLTQAGRRDEALAATRHALEIRRRLASDDPATHEPSLATSLSNLGAHLSTAGRRVEALTVTEQAVEIRRRLAADNPAAHEPALAASLSNLGNRLAQTGRPAEALVAAEQAVEIRRRLAADNPAAHEPDLARSLSNLGNRLSQAGRVAEGLAAEQEAVRIRRRLAADNPAAHEPDLARSLSRLGNRLSQTGRPNEAVTAVQEAVEIRHRLAAENRAAHLPSLARSLSNLGTFLSQAGRQAAALTTTEQAVELWRQLAAGDPAAHEPELASSLSDLSLRLSQAERRADALAAEQQAVEIRRRLAAGDPEAFETALAASLSSLGNRLTQAGRSTEALAALNQAVEIRRRLAALDPAAHDPRLAEALSSLGNRLSQTGRSAEAVTATEQAVEVLRHLATGDPATYEPSLAAALSNLGVRLSQTGQFAEALTVTEQSLEIDRRLAEYDPATYEPSLAATLTNLSIRLSQTGRDAEALATAEQAVDIYRRIAADDPTAHEPELASSLSNLASNVSRAGRLAEALTTEQQAIDIRRRLAANDPAAHEADLAGSLSNLSIWLSQAGQPAEALTAGQQAVEIRRRLAVANPATHERHLASSLVSLGNQLAQAGRPAEALIAAEQAVQSYRRLAADDPTTYEPDLATSLSVTALLWMRQDPSKALAANEEAADLVGKHIPTTPSLTGLLRSVIKVQARIREETERASEAQQARDTTPDLP